MRMRVLENLGLGSTDLRQGDTVDELELAALGADVGALRESGAIAPDDDEGGPADGFLAALDALDSAALQAAAADIASSHARCMLLAEIGMAVHAIHGGGDPADTGDPSRVKDGGAGPSDRVDQIRSAVQAILAKDDPANLTKGGLPTVPALEAATGIDDISAAERNDAVAWVQGQGE